MPLSEIIPQNRLEKFRPHQMAGAELATHTTHYCYFWDRGVGKTLLCNAIAKIKVSHNGYKVLIVTKENLIYDNIVPDMKLWFPEISFVVLAGARKHIANIKRILKSNMIPESQKPKVYITSFGVFRDIWDIICEGMDVLIIDESGLLRNAQSKLSVAFRHASDKYNFKCVYPMSGLPAPNSELEYFTQLYMVAPEIFGKSFNAYKEQNFRIARKAENNSGKYILKNPAEFREKMKPVSSYISRHDVFKNIKEPLRLKRYFDLTDEQQIYYYLVITQTKKYISDRQSEPIETLIPFLVKQVRWMQVICGLYKSEEGGQKELKTNLYDTMIDAIEDVNEPILIWCNYDYEQLKIINRLAKLGKSVSFVHGSQKQKDQRKARQAFKDGHVQYLVLKPGANAHGHNFQTVCSFAAYTSTTYSLDAKDQSTDRIFRPPYTKVCTILNLIARNTIAEVMDNAVENKRNVAMDVLNYLKK